MAAEAVVDDPDGNSTSFVWTATNLCLGLGCRAVHLYPLLNARQTPGAGHIGCVDDGRCVVSAASERLQARHNRPTRLGLMAAH